MNISICAPGASALSVHITPDASFEQQTGAPSMATLEEIFASNAKRDAVINGKSINFSSSAPDRSPEIASRFLQEYALQSALAVCSYGGSQGA